MTPTFAAYCCETAARSSPGGAPNSWPGSTTILSCANSTRPRRPCTASIGFVATPAPSALTKLIETLGLSLVPELKTLRRTLIKWRKEILAYFYSGRLTNARTEGFNLKAKLVKRRGYGYRSFDHYRLRLLNACRR